MLPASGCTTASAKAVATAASTALPPASSTSMPICEAIAFCEDTIALFARTGTEEASAGLDGACASRAAIAAEPSLMLAARLSPHTAPLQSSGYHGPS